MTNGKLFQLEIMAGKKEYESQFARRCLNLKLWFFLVRESAGVRVSSVRLHFKRREPVSNFAKKILNVDLAFDCPGIANLDSVTYKF